MKRLNVWGLVVGVLIGVSVASVFWIGVLIGSPTQHNSRFPVAKDPFPTNAYTRVHSGRVGFDVYINAKFAREIRKKEKLPVLKRGSGYIMAQQGGNVVIWGAIWIEYDRQFYKIGQYEKTFPGSGSDRLLFPMTKELVIDEARQITERFIIPDLGIDETFGPFQLP